MSGYLTDSISSTGSRTTFTISAWVKVNGTTINQTIFGAGTATTNTGKFYFAINNNQVRIGGGANVYRVTTGLFRDPASWYHLVCAVDTTQGSDGNRIKLYVNGESYTDFSAGYNTIPSNQNTPVNESGKINTFGAEQGGEKSWDGHMTHMVLVDGAQLTASNFGETDSTTGEWKPKADPTGVTYGTNGVFMKCENSGNFGLDSSGNGNNYTANSFPTGAFSTDCASNNFCVMNPLANRFAGSTFTNANLSVAMGSSQATFNTGTFGLTKGKWYFEMKPTALGSGTDNCLVGIVSRSDSNGTSDSLGEPTSIVYRNNGQKKSDSVNATYGASWTTSNIVMVAIDADNNNIYFGTDGQWADGSGNNDESNPTSAISFTNTMISDGVVFPAFGDLSTNSPEPAAQFNFGNPPFSISSGNADANGFGNFEYAVPSGYYALCTKNLAEYG
jgi:hypothetical protein